VIIVFLTFFVPLQSGSAEEEEDRDCMNPSRIHHSSAFFDPSYNELRARALAKAGHLEESIPWFLKASGGGKEDFPGTMELYCGQTYEKLGDFSEALKHYANGCFYFCGPLRADLLIKQNKFDEAMDLCNQGVNEGRKRQKEYRHQDYDKILFEWLLRRASIEISLQRYADAAADLKEAALWFAQDDSDNLNKCMREYEKLREHVSADSRILIQETDLPTPDKETIFKLLKFLVTTSKPVGVEALNNLIGSTLKVPGGIWVEPHADQQSFVTPSIGQVDYEATRDYDPASAWITVRIDTKRCALSHDSVESVMPVKTRLSSPIFDRCTGSPLKDAESWSLPAGTLILTFGSSGYRVLKEIEFRGTGICDDDPKDSRSQYASAMWCERHEDVETAMKHVTKAIALSAPDNQQLGRYYETRARLLDKLHETKSAIADSSMAVKKGGLAFIPMEVDLLAKDGKIEAAIDVLKAGIADTKFERERSLFELLTAKLYLQSNRFNEAIALAKSCISAEEKPDYNQKNRMPSYMGPYFEEVERMIAPAYVVKAKAEFGLGQFDEAHLSAEKAASLFFDIARIHCRDEILSWARAIPITNHAKQ
jgi:tetratricopeptide (TPR) repeat protein